MYQSVTIKLMLNADSNRTVFQSKKEKKINTSLHINIKYIYFPSAFIFWCSITPLPLLYCTYSEYKYLTNSNKQWAIN